MFVLTRPHRYHWPCQNIYVEPKEDEWHCLNCQVQQSLAEKAAKKLNKKRLEEHDKKRGKDSKHSIKESKHSTKDGRHSVEENKHAKSNGKEKPVKSDKHNGHNGHHDAQGSGKKRTKDAQKDEGRKLQKHLNSKKNGKSLADEPDAEEEEYYCPTCSKKDDCSPMVCCDDCDLW